MKRKLYVHIACAVDAMQRCEKTNNVEWQGKHLDAISYMIRNYLPSGGGIDSGVQIDLDRSNGERLVFNTAYHHMNDSGMYDGWTEHTVAVTPSLLFGFNLTVSGRDRNDIKNYLAEMFSHTLGEEIDNAKAYGVAEEETT